MDFAVNTKPIAEYCPMDKNISMIIRSTVPINLPALFNSFLSLIMLTGLYIANNFCIAILAGLCINSNANSQETALNPDIPATLKKSSIIFHSFIRVLFFASQYAIPVKETKCKN